ncbi:MAG TPA: class A beta-lactamase [Polyangiaceae bacterium]|nr:class A beta-lactamase [Polyangiaceae bacterium]
MTSHAPFDRRALLSGASLCVLGCAASVSPVERPTPETDARFAELERSVGGRLGVAAVDTGSARRVSYRAGERFPMCSTFKLPLVAAVLKRVDAGDESLGRRLAYDATALLEYAPVTREHVSDGGMSVEALCEAAITLSDNTAASLLLETLDGPSGLTAFFRAIGDPISRLDRNEPTLNTATPGDERDTTTPSAMLGVMQQLLLGNVLRTASKERLLGWLIATKTGLERLRAGLPAEYRAGDKTGTGENGATNDLAIAWPPSKPPILIAAYSWGSTASTERLSDVLAQAARLVLRD